MEIGTKQLAKIFILPKFHNVKNFYHAPALALPNLWILEHRQFKVSIKSVRILSKLKLKVKFITGSRLG